MQKIRTDKLNFWTAGTKLISHIPAALIQQQT